jgi:glutathione S-transferase
MAKPTLYGTPLSTFVRTARMALAEKGVDYDHVDVGVLDGECRQPEHLARHPFGKVPVLDHDGLRIYETSAVARYIDEAFDGPGLTPDDLHARTRMNQAIAIHDSYGYDSLILDTVAYYLFADFVGGRDDARLARGMETGATCLAEYERLLGDGPYIGGDRVSLGDLYLAPSYFYVTLSPAADELLGPHHRLAAWWDRMSARDATKATAPSFE